MTTLLIGASGQLGSELRQAFKDDDMILLSHATPELLDRIQEVRLPILYCTGMVRWLHSILN